MENGAIPDSWIDASSTYSPAYNFHLARLRNNVGWAALVNDGNQWLQVDLQQTIRVTSIATQGRSDYPQWVTKYKLDYGDDGQNFMFYRRNGDQSDTV